MLRQYFLQLFAEKLTKTPKHGSLFEKLLVLAKSMIFRAFSRNDSLFAQKFTKRPKHGSLLEKLLVLAKSMIFRAPSQNEPLFATFCWKVDKNAKTWWFPRRLASLGQIDDFSSFFTKWATFSNFLLKSWPKRGKMVVGWKSCNFWPNRWCFLLFHEMSHFLQLFAEKLTKTPKHGSFLEELQVLAKSMIFRAFSRNEPFSATFCWKVHRNVKTW